LATCQRSPERLNLSEEPDNHDNFGISRYFLGRSTQTRRRYRYAARLAAPLTIWTVLLAMATIIDFTTRTVGHQQFYRSH
jgi:hypothetical protein